MKKKFLNLIDKLGAYICFLGGQVECPACANTNETDCDLCGGEQMVSITEARAWIMAETKRQHEELIENLMLFNEARKGANELMDMAHYRAEELKELNK